MPLDDQPKRSHIYVDTSQTKFVVLGVVDREGLQVIFEEHNIHFHTKPAPLSLALGEFKERMKFLREMEDGERGRYFNAGGPTKNMTAEAEKNFFGLDDDD